MSGLAEASNSHALKGLVSVEGQGQIQGHQGLAALSTRHRSTPGAVLQRYNPAHCAVHVRLVLVDTGMNRGLITFARTYEVSYKCYNIYRSKL